MLDQLAPEPALPNALAGKYQSQVARLIPVRLSPPKAPTSSSDPELREEAYGVLLDEYFAPEEA